MSETSSSRCFSPYCLSWVLLSREALQRHIRGSKNLFRVWFLLFWGIFIFFYAGSYNYGADVRFALVSYIPIALIAGYGAAALEGLVATKIRIILSRVYPVLCDRLFISCDCALCAHGGAGGVGGAG